MNIIPNHEHHEAQSFEATKPRFPTKPEAKARDFALQVQRSRVAGLGALRALRWCRWRAMAEIHGCYPLVMTNIAIENHHFLWENSLLLWQFSIAMFVYQRVGTKICGNSCQRTNFPPRNR